MSARDVDERASAGIPKVDEEEAVAMLGRVQISRRRPEFTLPPMHKGLNLSPHTALSEVSSEGGRVFCDACDSSRRFFCHTCLTAFTPTPRVTLPCRVYFITDKKELLSKATGVQCALLAPDHVTLCRPHELPQLDPKTAVLLFPEEGASSVADIVIAAAENNTPSVGTAASVGVKSSSASPQPPPLPTPSPSSSPSPSPPVPPPPPPPRRNTSPALSGLLSAVVIIDSKWNGSHLIASTPNLRHLPRVKLASYRTAFWRFHPQPKSQEKRDERDALLAEGKDAGDDRLCSAEALFFFMRELHDAVGVHADADADAEDGEYSSGDGGDGGGEGGKTRSQSQTELQDDDGGGSGGDGGGDVNRGEGGGSGGASRCHCFDDLLWYFAWQHQMVAASATAREYHPIPPQLKKSARRRASRNSPSCQNIERCQKYKKDDQDAGGNVQVEGEGVGVGDEGGGGSSPSLASPIVISLSETVETSGPKVASDESQSGGEKT